MPTIEDLDGFQVDAELRALIPTPTTDELRGLVEDIERDGAIINPVVVWAVDGGFVLVDGHNRLDAWESLTGRGVDIPAPEYRVLEFPDRDAVKWWMIAHQLHRRNVDKVQRDRLLAQMYELAKRDRRDNLKRGTESPKGQSDPSGETGEKTPKPQSTAATVAAATGVSEKTVKRAVAAQKPKPEPKPVDPSHASLTFARKALGEVQSKVRAVALDHPEWHIDVTRMSKHAAEVYEVIETALRKAKR